MTRDVGRQQAYRAEDSIFGDWADRTCVFLPMDRESFRDLTALAEDFCRARGWISGPRRIEVCWTDRDFSTAFSGLRRIEYSTVRLSAHVALHEVAHVAAPGDGHGSTWRERYCALVAEFVGQTFADRLARAFQTEPLRRRCANRRARRTFVLERQGPDRDSWTVVTDKCEASEVRKGCNLREMRDGSHGYLWRRNASGVSAAVWYRMRKVSP